MPPTIIHGKVCYVEIPSNNVQQSAEFYQSAFGWNVRQRHDGSTAFDDSTSEVSGTWVLGREPSRQQNLIVYIMVDSVAGTLDKIVAKGGQVVQPIGADAPEITARFSDPTGNVFGLYQEPNPSGNNS